MVLPDAWNHHPLFLKDIAAAHPGDILRWSYTQYSKAIWIQGHCGRQPVLLYTFQWLFQNLFYPYVRLPVKWGKCRIRRCDSGCNSFSRPFSYKPAPDLSSRITADHHNGVSG